MALFKRLRTKLKSERTHMSFTRGAGVTIWGDRLPSAVVVPA